MAQRLRHKEAETMSAQDNMQLARTVYEAFSRGDLEAGLAYAAEDVEVVLIPFGLTFHGRDGFSQFMHGFKDAFPDLAIIVGNQVADDDQVVSEFTATGTHRGPLMTPAGAIPPTGRTVTFTVCEVWRVRDGRLVSLRNYQDAAGIMQQLGVVPEPTSSPA
jgi:steroid delta-isomerase-like uncharacterized protein